MTKKKSECKKDTEEIWEAILQIDESIATIKKTLEKRGQKGPIIVEASTLKEALKKVFDMGLRPATVQEIKQLKKDGQIPKDKWYDTGTLRQNGADSVITKEEAQNIENIYDAGGRLFFVNGIDVGLDGSNVLNYVVGRFVGMAQTKEEK